MTPPTTSFDIRTSDALIGLLQGAQNQLEVTEFSNDIAAGTTLGYVRKENQDRYLMARYCHPDPRRNFFVSVVADGVGSLAESGWAAAAAISAFVSGLVTEMERPGSALPFWREVLRRAVEGANQFVFNKNNERGATTLSAVLVPVVGNSCGIHVGDSKIFGVDRDFRFTQLSKDQTIGSQLQALGLHSGPPEDRDPRLDRSLAQYIGMPDRILPQLMEIEPKWETLALASDGILAARRCLNDEGWNMLAKASKSKSDLVRKVLHLCNWLGGADNSTLILLPSRPESDSGKQKASITLIAATYSRSLEIHFRSTASSEPREPFSSSERKRSKGSTRGKKGQRSRQPHARPEESGAKPVPTITFLPGLAKDENAPRNPGSL